MKRASTRPSEALGAAPPEAAKDRQFVTALARGLEVLRCFKRGDVRLGNLEISQRTGLPKPTVSRLTHTLTKLGYLSYSQPRGSYQLGAGVLALGYAMLSGLDLRSRARPLMQGLADHANASVGMGGRDRLSMVYLECCRGPGAVTLSLDVGSRVPLATSAMGRALMAVLPDSERAYLMDHIRAKAPDELPRVKTGIERAIHDIEARGFCLSLGDWQPDVHAAGVPLVTPDRTVYALNCGGPSFMMSQRQLEEDYGPKLVEIVRQISAEG